jgi:hypothetical protein
VPELPETPEKLNCVVPDGAPNHCEPVANKLRADEPFNVMFLFSRSNTRLSELPSVTLTVKYCPVVVLVIDGLVTGPTTVTVGLVVAQPLFVTVNRLGIDAPYE